MSFLPEHFAQAIKDGNSTLIESLLANGSIDANARLPGYANPPALILATTCDERAVVDVLLRFGARIDDIDDRGRTACHVAAYGNAEMLALLLAHKPNVGLRCQDGNTPLENSLSFDIDSGEHMNDFERIALMLIEAGAPLEDVHGLCHLAATSTSAIRALHRRGVVFDKVADCYQRTALHFAVAMRDSAVVDMLVNECGQDLEVRDYWESTCTHTAVINKNADAVRLLLAAGANLQSLDRDRRTPLHIVRDEKCTILLLAAGADVHARDVYGRTPCICRVLNPPSQTHCDVQSTVTVMLAVGADLDAADHSGITARQLLADHQVNFNVDAAQVDAARRKIAKVRLDFVRQRAFQVCIGLQSRELDALQMCEILVHACGPVAPVIPFHQWWKIVITVKHFKSSNSPIRNSQTID
jgi:ankyrin repeat protein